MGKPANFEVVSKKDGVVFIRDIGPWDVHFTCTNDPESVVARLTVCGVLGSNDKLLYDDSDGNIDEILHEGGQFKGFAPGPNNRGKGVPVIDFKITTGRDMTGRDMTVGDLKQVLEERNVPNDALPLIMYEDCTDGIDGIELEGKSLYLSPATEGKRATDE